MKQPIADRVFQLSFCTTVVKDIGAMMTSCTDVSQGARLFQCESRLIFC
jgi:hypothetical protein